MNCRELRSFLEIIPLKNPKLKVSYAAFQSKRKKYQTEGMFGIFPKYFMPDNKSEEPEDRRNLNRLPKVYNLATTEQLKLFINASAFGFRLLKPQKLQIWGTRQPRLFISTFGQKFSINSIRNCRRILNPILKSRKSGYL